METINYKARLPQYLYIYVPITPLPCPGTAHAIQHNWFVNDVNKSMEHKPELNCLPSGWLICSICLRIITNWRAITNINIVQTILDTAANNCPSIFCENEITTWAPRAICKINIKRYILTNDQSSCPASALCPGLTADCGDESRELLIKSHNWWSRFWAQCYWQDGDTS